MSAPEFEIIARQGAVEVHRCTISVGEFTLGRASSSNIPIKVGPVSRQHARIIVSEDGAVAIEDLGSANGTQLGDTTISGLAPWSPGQTVRIGDVEIELAPVENPVSLPTNLPAFGGDIVARHLPLTERRAQRLDIEKEIARGGMGAVLEARESATRRTVAMKVMLRDDGDARGTLRFIEEAQVTAQLEHPNIVPVHDLGLDERGQPFYTMKLVSGITLKKVLELLREGVPETVEKYPLSALLTVFQKICDALAFAHSRGVIHRDLKPANIMLGRYGEVMVMDWGLAKVIGRSSQLSTLNSRPVAEATIMSARREELEVGGTMAGSVMGTPHYMSPEQARGEVETLDARSDLFSLGAILYELVTLERPFAGRNAAELLAKIIAGDFVPPAARVAAAPRRRSSPRGALPPLSAGGGAPPLRQRVPESLDAIVCKAMALDREHRYPSVQALQADLTAYQTGFATSAESRSAWKQVKLLIKRNKAASIGLAAVLLVGTTLGTGAIFQGLRAERALGELRETAPALRQLVETEATLQRFDSALQKLDAALRLDPSHLPSYWRRAWLFIALERWSDAAAALRLAQEKDRPNAAQAAILPLLDRFAGARSDAERWSPGDATTLFRHLRKVGASSEIGPISAKLQLGKQDKLALVEKRLRAWLPKGSAGQTYFDEEGRVAVRLDNYVASIDTVEPLRNLQIESLRFSNSKVSSLEPLRGMPLQVLDITNTKVVDLSPLAGMPLVSLVLSNTAVEDLTALQDLRLQFLDLTLTKVRSLEPLRGMPLRTLVLAALKMSDLAPLRGMQLESLDLQDCSAIKDFTPLLDCRRLQKVRVSGYMRAPASVLRRHPTLSSLASDGERYVPAAKFWANYDAEQAAGKK